MMTLGGRMVIAWLVLCVEPNNLIISVPPNGYMNVPDRSDRICVPYQT